MNLTEYTFGHYILRASNGKKIRRACLVYHQESGKVIHFLDLVGRNIAIQRAKEIWAKHDELERIEFARGVINEISKIDS